MAKGRTLRSITAARRPETENPNLQAKGINAAANDSAEWKTLRGVCMNENCKQGENKTRKQIFGGFYGTHNEGRSGTCSKECEQIIAARPKFPDHPPKHIQEQSAQA